MRNNRVGERACRLERTVVEGVRYDETAGAIVVSARPDAKARNRCGRCGRRSPGYDHSTDRPVSVCAVEEPQRRQPAAASTARMDRQDRPPPVAGLPPQRRTRLRIQGNEKKARQASTNGCHGHGGRSSPPSPISPTRSPNTATPSTLTPKV